MGNQEKIKAPKIMTKPLPEILDEVEAAAADARKAADEARQAGLDAAEDVRRAVGEELCRIEAIADEVKALALVIATALDDASTDIHAKAATMKQ